VGRAEQEPGILSNAKALGNTYHRRRIRLREIVELLKSAARPITRHEVIERLGVTPSSAFRTRLVLAKEGLVRVTHHREGTRHCDTAIIISGSNPPHQIRADALEARAQAPFIIPETMKSTSASMIRDWI